MISKPVFRDGDKTCSPNVAAVAGSQHQALAFWSGSAPAPKKRALWPVKNRGFVTSVTFAVYCSNQHGEEVKNLLISSTRETR
ncbi:hypothetical protein Y032_0181g855 [Ancylostoma ceylanicum]|nr:hypothetical protein Y032_0181g855 [Ancylostoma ceylanicum]